MTKSSYPLVIIGGGPAGLTAAIYATRAAIDCLVIERGMAGGMMFNTHRIENYPGFPQGVEGPELSRLMEEQAKILGTEFLQKEVSSIEINGQKKIVHLGEQAIECKALIVATGCYPNTLGIPGESQMMGRGVSYCATCDGNFFRGVPVAVIGGGDSAVQEAILLAHLCKEVHVIHRRDQLRAVPALQEAAEKLDNIHFVWDTVAEEVLGENGVSGLKLRNKKTNAISELEVEGVFIYVGIKPITDFMGDLLEKTPDNYIKAGEDTCTNIPGIFVAGDVRKKPTRQIASAIGDGCSAVKAVEDYLIKVGR